MDLARSYSPAATAAEGAPGVAAVSPPLRSYPDVLGSGTGIYGYRSIMRGASMAPARSNIDASLFLGHSLRSPTSSPVAPGSGGSLQEVTRLGNEWYKKGKYMEALRHYGRAVPVPRERCRLARPRLLSISE